MRTKLLTGCLAAALALSALAEAPAPAKAIKLTLAERIAATRLIATVQLVIGACLLHHEHVHPQAQEGVELVQGQFRKGFDGQMHARGSSVSIIFSQAV